MEGGFQKDEYENKHLIANPDDYKIANKKEEKYQGNDLNAVPVLQ